MRKLVYILMTAMMTFFTVNANALEIGDEAPCVVLEQVAQDGFSFTACIREPREETHQFTIIEFFSGVCSACQENIPNISLLAEELKENATVRLVGIDRNRDLVNAFIDRNRDLILFDVAYDSDRDAKRAYDVFVTPTIFILDRENVVRYKHSGVLSEANMNEIRTLVNGKN